MMKKQIIGSIFAIMMATLGIIFPLSPSAPERTLLYFDNFEDETVKWLGVGDGSVSKSTEMAFSGSASMNITASSWSNMESLFQMGTPENPLPVLSLEFWFAAPEQIGYFCFGLEISSARRNQSYCGAIMFPQCSYLNPSDAWSPVEGLAGLGWDLSQNYRIWHHAELSMDIKTGSYLEVSIDDETVNLEALNYTCKQKPNYFWGIIYPWFYSGGSSVPCSILVDDVALYMEEAD